MKGQPRGMAERPLCVVCGSTIWSNNNLSKRKYCSPECRDKAGVRNMNALRYAAPRPLASRGEFSVGQTVRVPAVERRTIDGREVRVTVTEYATVRKVTARYIVVSVGNVTRRCTREQLNGARVEDMFVPFGSPLSQGER